MHNTLMSTAELAARLGDPSLVVVDVRHDLAQPERWGEDAYRASHIPGARFAHTDRDLSAPKTGKNGRHPLPAPEAAAATFGRLGIGDGTQVVAYDAQTGMFASRLWWMLRWLGHESVAVLDGGFDKWKREGHPVTADVPAAAPARFTIRRLGPIATADEIVASLDGRSLTVVDARAPERYRGEVEPIDPVPGRIPGSVNRPASQNLGADSTFKSPAQLRAEFERLLAGTAAERVVHSCGSGVAACHNALAMEVAGFAPSRLYPGSWSEWIADPSRPIARG